MVVAASTPLRRCRVCYQQFPKSELTRWVIQDGSLTEDPAQRLPGRGYYSCSPEHAAKLAEKIKPNKTKKKSSK